MEIKGLLGLFLIVGLALFGCEQRNTANFKVISQNDIGNNKDATISEVEYDVEKMVKLYSLYDENEENGLYMFNTSETTKYILFHSKGVIYSNISFEVKDEVLKIKYNSKVEEGYGQNILFLIKKNNEESYDTIELENNGKSDFFINSIIVGN